MTKFTLKLFILIGLTLQVSLAGNSAAQVKSVKEVNISLNEMNTSLLKVFQEIEKSTDYTFNFSKDKINLSKRVSIGQENASVERILLDLSKEHGLAFKQVNNNISVFRNRGNATQDNIELEILVDVEISGQVTDENGEGLPGASVVVKGTTNGTTTDLDGNYKLTLQEGAFVTISFVGYVTREIEVGKRSTIDVQMVQDASQLEEVVVVGYGTSKKTDLTGSVSNMSSDNIVNKPFTNSEQALSGRIAGVQITSQSGKPGNDGAQIRIRGVGTLNNSNPLILVDGLQSSMSDIPPGDIESITVLKDAAASAIYGARAANGVILVTTKRGKVGDKTNINYNSYVGLQKATNIVEQLDSWDYAELQNESRTNRGLAPFWSAEQIQGFKDGNDPDLYPNTDWIGLLFQTAPIQNHHLSMSGGNEDLQFTLSGGYLSQDGIEIGSEYKRYNFRSNIDSKINSFLKVGVNLYGSRGIEESTFGQPGGDPDATVPKAMRTAIRYSPTIPLYNADGSWGGPKQSRPGERITLGNAVAQASIYDAERISSKFLGKFFGEVTFLKDFKFKSSFGYENNNANGAYFEPTVEFTDGETGVVIRSIGNNTLKETHTFSTLATFENTLNYNKVFNNVHGVKVLLGASQLSYRRDRTVASKQTFPNNDLQEFDAGAENATLSGGASEWAFISYFGRVNYSYDQRYLIEANVRYDGSSRFGASNRYGTFPSFSAGWRLSNESFMSDVALVQDLKLRGSWGQLGNSEIGEYGYTPAIAPGQDYVFGGNVAPGGAPTALANADIKWEVVTMSNIGIDFSLFDYKLSVTADYFNKITNDILVRVPIPQTFGGLSAPFKNAGKVQNKGIELGLSYANSKGEFEYDVYANGTHITNEVVRLADQTIYHTSGKFITKEGEPFYSVFGYQVEGIFQTQQEVDEHATQGPITSLGDLKYKDVDDNGVINADDRTIIGNTVPKFSYGFGGNLRWKGFDFNVHFQGVEGRDMILDSWGRESMSGIQNTVPKWLSRWTPENTNTDIPRLGFSHNHINSEFWMEDASYLRLKNLELGYTLSKELSQRVSIQRLRVYVSSQNLMTFTNYSGFDPELSNPYSRTDEYPVSKIMTIGINLTL